MQQFPFEKLTVWQKAKEFTLEIYKTTSDFPNEEKFGLTSQIRRASVSVASNMAEGSARKSKKVVNRARYGRDRRSFSLSNSVRRNPVNAYNSSITSQAPQ